MAFASCLSHSSPLPFKQTRRGQKFPFPIRSNAVELCEPRILRNRVNLQGDWSFIGGSRVIVKPKVVRYVLSRKSNGIYASWLSGSQLSSSVFTLATAAVLPFYTLMVLAPKSELTKKSMESSIPYIVLGVLYAYLLYLSWTPETVRQIFASKYLLPELTSIGKMFSSEMTLASAWIHLLVVDLFAARCFMTEWRTKLRPGIQSLFAFSFAPLGFLLTSSPNQ